MNKTQKRVKEIREAMDGYPCDKTDQVYVELLCEILLQLDELRRALKSWFGP